MMMKKLLSVVFCFCLATGAFAQGFGSRMADVNLDYELGESPFTFAPVSYIYFGFNGLMNTDDNLNKYMGFFRSQQFGLNMLELAMSPFPGGRLSLGADFTMNWFNLNKDYMWIPYGYPVNGQPQGWGTNGRFVTFGPKEDYGIHEVKQSVLSVYTFGFPLTFSYTVGKVTMALGATLELNLDGKAQFKGVDTAGNNINEMKSGKRFSKKIGTNRLGFNVHAAFSYGGLGIFAKYNPIPKFYKGEMNGAVVYCGPQFQSWTVGLIIGLGM